MLELQNGAFLIMTTDEGKRRDPLEAAVEAAVGGAGEENAGVVGGTTAQERAKFERLADRWWDPDGPMRPLHMMNPVRLAFFRDEIVRHLKLDAASLRPFAGVRVLDVGCGGGILAEPLSRLGAEVTGIDLESKLVETARAHAAEMGLDKVRYELASTDELIEQGQLFDVVIASEVVEHTEDPKAFIASLAYLVRPGGLVLLTTPARTLRSFGQVIVAAEYLLRWLPRGTHDWRKFLKPAEAIAYIRQAGLVAREIAGISYDVAKGSFHRSQDVGVNYMLSAVRPT